MALANGHKMRFCLKRSGAARKKWRPQSGALSFPFGGRRRLSRSDLNPTTPYIASVAKQAIGARVETSYGRGRLPGLFVVERQLRLQGQLPGIHRRFSLYIIEVILIKAT
jgi:hypothetical protein